MVPRTPDPKPSWRPKTTEERGRDFRGYRRARLSPIQPLIIGAVAALVGAGVVVWACFIGGAGGWMYLPVLLTFAILAFGGGAALLAYLMQVLGILSRPQRLRLGVCTRCFKFSLDGRDDVCECGGRFEDADGWTPNRCPACDYDLRGIAVDRCPECGTNVAAPLSQPKEVSG